MRVILDINIDGFETDEEHNEAVLAFIKELNHISISVKLESVLPDEEVTDGE